MMAIALLAQRIGGGMANWGLQEILITVVVLLAVFSLVYLALRWFEITIDPIIIKIFWICVMAFLFIMAIRFVFSL